MIALQLSGESAEASKFPSLLGLHQLHSKLMNPPVIQIRQEMSDSISNPNLLTGSGWKKKRKADEKGNLPRRLSVESKILACRQRLICVCIFSEACIMALTLSLLIVTISSKPPC